MLYVGPSLSDVDWFLQSDVISQSIHDSSIHVFRYESRTDDPGDSVLSPDFTKKKALFPFFFLGIGVGTQRMTQLVRAVRAVCIYFAQFSALLYIPRV